MKLLFQLIQIALGNRENLASAPSEKEWKKLYYEAQRQSIVGILFSAIEKLPDEQRPPEDILLDAIGYVQLVEQQSKINEQRSHELSEMASNRGFKNCVLKGIGVACLYPNPYLRQTGDIDLWVDGKRSDVMKWLRSKYTIGAPVWHNVSAKIFEDVEVEIHFHPSWSYNPVYAVRLERYFQKQKERQMNMGEGLNYPDVKFNAVMCLSHTYRHFIAEGIGLRHVIDYYYIVSALAEIDKTEVVKTIEKCGMYKFLSAMMFVLQEVCCLPDSLLLCSPDIREGNFVLSEIIASGNFGKWRRGGELKKNSFRRFRVMVRHYPGEVLWVLPWRIWHRLWRLFNR